MLRAVEERKLTKYVRLGTYSRDMVQQVVIRKVKCTPPHLVRQPDILKPLGLVEEVVHGRSWALGC